MKAGTDINWMKNAILIINLTVASSGLHTFEKISRQEKEVNRLAEKLKNAKKILRQLKEEESHKVVFPMKPDEEERE